MTLIRSTFSAALDDPPHLGHAVASSVARHSKASNKLYLAAWRWHFYAGLFVVPFLLMLAVTGFGMMVLVTYFPEYGERIQLDPASVTAGETHRLLTPEAQVAAAVAAVPGAVGWSEYVTPYSAKHPARVTVTGLETVVVALDPVTGRALRQTVEGDTWKVWLERVHGTLLLGTLGDRLIEVATGLALILLATGLYLWWPRGSGAASTWRKVLLPRLTARGRAAWKFWHATLGFWTSAALLALLLTGMAWTGIWGERWVQAWSTFPAAKWDDVPLSDSTHASLNRLGDKQVPWGLEQTPLPLSGSEAGEAIVEEDGGAADNAGSGHAGAESGVGGHDRGVMAAALPTESGLPDLAALLAIGRSLGMEGRLHVVPPTTELGVWTLSQDSMSYDSSDATADRTVHVDRFSGRVLADVGFADYRLAAQGMAVGIALHEGQLGLWNVMVNGAACLVIVFLCVSGVMMWWKRRPRGTWRMAPPPAPPEMPLWKGAFAIAVALAMLFPLVGITLITIALFDTLVLRWIRRIRHAVAQRRAPPAILPLAIRAPQTQASRRSKSEWTPDDSVPRRRSNPATEHSTSAPLRTEGGPPTRRHR